MIARGFFLPLVIVGIIACEPMNKKEEALDKSAVFDQKPVRNEGWTIEGNNSAVFDGLALSTTPTSQSDGFTQQELSLNNASMFKKLPALVGSETGTFRLKFSLPKLAQSGLRFDISFATGVGLPAEVRISKSGITAKCGYLNASDASPTASFAKTFEMLKDYELRVVRTSTAINVLLDKEVVVKDLACVTLQDGTQEPRSSGHLKFTLFSQIPAEPVTWTASEMLLHESQLVLKRVTIHKEARLE